MRYVVPTVLLIVALIHALPLLGVAGAARLSTLYGIPVTEPNLELLLRHRAVLFGLLAAFLVNAAFHRPLHGLALIAAAVSVGSFLVLAALAGPLNAAVATVVKVDVAALVLLALAGLAHWSAAPSA